MSIANKNKFSFTKAGVILLQLTLIAKFLAFCRELAVAAYFGSSNDTDSFFIAYGLIANILYGLATAFATTFLPLYVEERENRGRVFANKFAGQSIVFFSSAAIAIAAVVFALSGALTKIIAPSVPPAQAEQIALFIRILTAGLIFSLLNSFACSLLDAERIFGSTAISGIIYSAAVIASAVFFSKNYGITSLIIAISGANLLQFLFSGLRSCKYITLALPSKKDSRLWKMLLLAVPILLSNTTIEINQIINRSLAINLGKGIVSAFSYASTLTVFVTSTLVYSLVTIFFTEFSKAACADNSLEKIRKLLQNGLNILLIILLPLTCITFIYAEDIVTIALMRGKFTAEDVVVTAQGLRWMAPGIFAIVVKALFTKCFISMKNTLTPMIVSICEVFLNIVLVILLSKRFGISGISAAMSTANLCAAFALFILLNKNIGGAILKYSLGYILKSTISTVCAITLLCVLRLQLGTIVPFCRLTLATAAGFASFALLYWHFFKHWHKRSELSPKN